ncbi:MAG: hypothetical protein EXS13_11645 [Planctomycetes bacterium]|nr:hypothetical protein [Planctomycetota bacterium]
MSKAVRVTAAAAVLLLFGGALFFLQTGGNGGAAAGVAPLDLSTSDSCRDCHADIWAEWQSSFHAQSFTDPLVLAKEQSNNFRNQACIPCHAPEPVFETGLGKVRVIERVTQRERGVDCLSCHRAFGAVVGPAMRSPGAANAPCAPIGDAQLASPALCAPCHNQHNTVDEWESSRYPATGVTCLDCHMQPVERKNADGRVRRGRSHRFPGGHDLETLQKAATIEAAVARSDDGSRRLVVRLTNSGAGHNYPADARHRALDLVVTLIQQDGVLLPPRDGGRGYGRERGTERRRFRNPYREETERLTNRELFGRENTQIGSGETITFEVPFDPAAVASARVELIYKLTPIQTDDEGVRVHDQVILLR